MTEQQIVTCQSHRVRVTEPLPESTFCADAADEEVTAQVVMGLTHVVSVD